MITSIEIQAIKDAIEIHNDESAMAKNCLRVIEKVEANEKVKEEFEKTIEDLREGVRNRDHKIYELEGIIDAYRGAFKFIEGEIDKQTEILDSYKV